MDRLWIRGARVTDGTQPLQTRDVLIEDGRIAAESAPPQGAENVRVLDADGLVCAPGLVDMHVHLRDPGQTYKEDIFSGCNAAAAGGVTSLACMPNTVPACDGPGVVADIVKRAAHARARVYPVAAVSRGLGGEEITDFAALKAAGAVAVSDDGRPVLTAGMMEQALRLAKETGLRVLAHCEELSLVRGGIMNEGEVSRRLGLPGISPAAEDVGTAREIALAAATGCPVHICHVSTAGSVALIRDARRRGVPVTGETAPHYCLLTERELERHDADFRMNPPLRTRRDAEAVIEALRDGTLTAIATDHAPHTPEEKADFFKAPNGSIGTETSLAACITALVEPGHLTLERLVALMSREPARLLGIPAGTLEPGASADLVLFDPAARWTVMPEKLHGKSRNTPFKGMTFTGKVAVTVLGGRPVYQDGQLL